jgi:hypothetical protein
MLGDSSPLDNALGAEEAFEFESRLQQPSVLPMVRGHLELKRPYRRASSYPIMFYEGARVHEERYKQYGDRLADMANPVRDGLQLSVDRDPAFVRSQRRDKKRAAVSRPPPFVLRTSYFVLRT